MGKKDIKTQHLDDSICVSSCGECGIEVKSDFYGTYLVGSDRYGWIDVYRSAADLDRVAA